MRVASTVGGLSLVLLLALLLAGCSGQDPEKIVAELTNVGGEASTSGGESGDGSASSTGTTAADAQSPTNEETPSQAAQAAQQVVDQIAGVDAEGAYSRGLQAARSAAKPGGCEPTPSEVLGPYYVPDAPASMPATCCPARCCRRVTASRSLAPRSSSGSPTPKAYTTTPTGPPCSPESRASISSRAIFPGSTKIDHLTSTSGWWRRAFGSW